MLLLSRIFFWSPLVLSFLTLTPTTNANGPPNDTNYNVSLEECMDATGSSYLAPLCCHVFTEMDPIMQACLKKHAAVMPSGNENELPIWLSMVSECYYRGKKYIKSNHVLNIGKVKADSAKDFGNGTFQANFRIEMYRTCAREAKHSLEQAQMDPMNDEFLKRLHHPFFLFIFSCVSNFSTKKCPYFRWVGERKGGQDKICFDYAKQCDKYVDEINSHE